MSKSLLLDPDALFIMQLAGFDMDFTNMYGRYLQDGGYPIEEDKLNAVMKGLVDGKFMTLWNHANGMGTAKLDWPGLYLLGCWMPLEGAWGVGQGRRVKGDKHAAD